MDFVSVDHMTNFFHGLYSHFLGLRDLTSVKGVSYLYVDHKSGEEVCIPTICLGRPTYLVGGHRETASRLLRLI